MSMKNLKDTIGNRTRDLPVCSTGMETDYFLCQAETKFLSIILLYFTLDTGRLSGQTDRQTDRMSLRCRVTKTWSYSLQGLLSFNLCIRVLRYKSRNRHSKKKEQDWRTRAHNNTQTNLHRTSISIEVKNKRLKRSKKYPLHYLNRGFQHRTHQLHSSKTQR